MAIQKSVAPVHVSGIPFVSGVADGGSSAVLMYEHGFEYSQGSGLVATAITASSGTFLSGVSVNGHFTATSKSFLIDHPTQKDAKLQYGSLKAQKMVFT